MPLSSSRPWSSTLHNAAVSPRQAITMERGVVCSSWCPAEEVAVANDCDTLDLSCVRCGDWRRHLRATQRKRPTRRSERRLRSACGAHTLVRYGRAPRRGNLNSSDTKRLVYGEVGVCAVREALDPAARGTRRWIGALQEYFDAWGQDRYELREDRRRRLQILLTALLNIRGCLHLTRDGKQARMVRDRGVLRLGMQP
jgi:hypothetical protein